MKQISQTAGTWISEEEIPVSPALKIIRANDPWQGMTDEEAEDAKEFIRCYLLKEHETILQVPVQHQENDFWAPNHPDFQESAFNTYDFQRNPPTFQEVRLAHQKNLRKNQRPRNLPLQHQPTGRKRKNSEEV